MKIRTRKKTVIRSKKIWQGIEEIFHEKNISLTHTQKLYNVLFSGYDRQITLLGTILGGTSSVTDEFSEEKHQNVRFPDDNFPKSQKHLKRD